MAQAASGSETAGKPQPAPTTGLPVARRIAFWAFAALVVLAGVFYLWWGFSFGVWLDNGVYAVFITLLLFGLAGMWLVFPNPSTAPPETP